MKKLGGFMLVAGLALVGCGGRAQVVVLNDGALTTEALASTDSVASKCPVKRNDLNAIQEEAPAPNRPSDSAAVFENSAPPQRTSAGGVWGTKYPLVVAVDRGSVDVAVIDDGAATVRIAYVERPRDDTVDGAYRRVRFVPCAEDASQEWRFWPGAFIADRENACVKVAIRDGRGELSVERLSLGNGCPEGAD